MNEVSFKELVVALLLGLAISAAALISYGVAPGHGIHWPLAALALAGFKRPHLAQALLIAPIILAQSFLTGEAFPILLVPCVALLLAEAELSPLKQNERWSADHALTAGAGLLAMTITDAAMHGLWDSAVRLLSTIAVVSAIFPALALFHHWRSFSRPGSEFGTIERPLP